MLGFVVLLFNVLVFQSAFLSFSHWFSFGCFGLVLFQSFKFLVPHSNPQPFPLVIQLHCHTCVLSVSAAIIHSSVATVFRLSGCSQSSSDPRCCCLWFSSQFVHVQSYCLSQDFLFLFVFLFLTVSFYSAPNWPRFFLLSLINQVQFTFTSSLICVCTCILLLSPPSTLPEPRSSKKTTD